MVTDEQNALSTYIYGIDEFKDLFTEIPETPNSDEDLKPQIDAQHKLLDEIVALSTDMVKNEETILRIIRTLSDTVKLLSERLARVEEKNDGTI